MQEENDAPTAVLKNPPGGMITVRKSAKLNPSGNAAVSPTRTVIMRSDEEGVFAVNVDHILEWLENFRLMQEMMASMVNERKCERSCIPCAHAICRIILEARRLQLPSDKEFQPVGFTIPGLEGTPQVEMLPLQGKPTVGNLYLASFKEEVYRVELKSVSDPMCSVRQIDTGNEVFLPISELKVLPSAFSSCPNLIVKVSGIAAAAEGAMVDVLPFFQENEGSWVYQVAMEPFCTSCGPQKLLLPTPINALQEEHMTRLLIPANTFSQVSVVHAGPEGIFAVPMEKMDYISDLSDQLSNMELEPFQTPPVVGCICVAPVHSRLFRARVICNGRLICRIGFHDFGNEIHIPTQQLRQLPPNFPITSFAFKMKPEPNSAQKLSVEFGTYTTVAVNPIAVDLDGAIIVEIA